jgi:hypothetical protein
MKNFPPKKKETERQEINNDKEDNQKEIQIYNSRNNKPLDSNQTKTSSYLKGRSSEENKDFNRTNKRNQYNEKYSDNAEDSNENYQRYNAGRMRRNRNSSSNLNFRNNDRNDEFDFNDSIGTNMDDYSESERPKKRRKKSKVENDFNIFEVIISQFLCCFMSKNLKLKNSANEKAREILFKQMDINTYVRNMILFNIMNQTIIDGRQKVILNFLSRPLISVEQKNKNTFDEFYKDYKEKDFNKYYDQIQELVQKQKKEEREEKLISISNERLKAFVY